MERIRKILEERKAKGLFRCLHNASSKSCGRIRIGDREYYDFSSNDYLGLSEHPELKDAARDAIEKLGTSASASRILSGSLDIHHELEDAVSSFKSKEAAIVFNSGYQANVGIISALYGKNDVIFFDKLSHASILDGILLSKANFFRFRHNDIEHLEYLLKMERNKFDKSLIITETIFSMDGDKAPLEKIVEIKDKYDSWFLADEAHATGIFGINGSGVAEETGLTDRIELVMGTFSKALGSFGAYLATSRDMKNYLINFSRSFIYSTALPPAVIAANLASINLIKEEPFRRKVLMENSRYFRDLLLQHGFNIRGVSQIIPLILGDAQKAVRLSEKLKEKGYWAAPIRPPTVPINESRLRFSLSYQHPKELLKKLAGDIYELRNI